MPGFGYKTGRQGRRKRGGSAPASFDFIISTDADWGNIPAGLLSGGGTIGVAPGNYTSKQLTARPSAPLIFTATNTGNLPKLNNFILFDAANLDFRYMDFISALWDGQGTPVVGVKSATAGPGLSDIWIRSSCKVRGNYRGNVDYPFDPNKLDYPEYASLCPQFNTTTGAVTGYLNDGSTILYVGDLVADGNWPVTFSNLSGGGAGSNVTFTAAPSVEMIVSGGFITGINIISGGTMTTDHSGGIAGLNADVATLGKICSWTGKKAMINYLAPGFAVITGAGLKSEQVLSGPFHIHDSLMYLLGNSVKFSAGNWLDIQRNVFDTIYMDSIASKQYVGASKMTVANNFFVNIFCKQGHPGDPHPDVISQLWTTTGTLAAGFLDNYYIGNVFSIGFGTAESANGQGQGLFWQWLSSTPAHGYGGMLVGNVVLTRRSGNAIDIDHIEDLICFCNIVTHYNPAEAGSSIQRLDLAGVQRTGENFVGLNIAEKMTLGSAGSGIINQDYPNLTIGNNGSAISGGITTLFPNFYLNDKNTLGEINTALQRAAAYAVYNQPAGMIDYVGKSFDPTLLPVCVNFTTLAEQAQTTAVNSGWKKVQGYPNTLVTFTTSTGTVEYANNAAGTGASSPASSGSFTLDANGEAWIRASHTTASGGTAPVIQAVALNGWVWNFTSITAVVAAYTRVNASTTAYAKAVSPVNVTGFTGLILAARVKINTHFNGARIFAAETSVKSRMSIDGASIGSATLRHGIIHTATHVASFTGGFDTNWMTIISLIDFTKTVNDDIVKCMVNNSRRPLAGSGNTIDTAGTRTFQYNDLFGPAAGSGFGLGAESDGGVIGWDHSFEWLWMNAFTSAEQLPDIVDPLVSSKFSADHFNSDGSISGLIGQPDWFYYFTDLTEANSGGGSANRGSLASVPLIKQAGTYV